MYVCMYVCVYTYTNIYDLDTEAAYTAARFAGGERPPSSGFRRPRSREESDLRGIMKTNIETTHKLIVSLRSNNDKHLNT